MLMWVYLCKKTIDRHIQDRSSKRVWSCMASKLIELSCENISIRAIARELGVDSKTVKNI